jgi:hypothetical protein
MFCKSGFDLRGKKDVSRLLIVWRHTEKPLVGNFFRLMTNFCNIFLQMSLFSQFRIWNNKNTLDVIFFISSQIFLSFFVITQWQLLTKNWINHHFHNFVCVFSFKNKSDIIFLFVSFFLFYQDRNLTLTSQLNFANLH